MASQWPPTMLELKAAMPVGRWTQDDRASAVSAEKPRLARGQVAAGVGVPTGGRPLQECSQDWIKQGLSRQDSGTDPSFVDEGRKRMTREEKEEKRWVSPLEILN